MATNRLETINSSSILRLNSVSPSYPTLSDEYPNYTSARRPKFAFLSEITSECCPGTSLISKFHYKR